jgi:hypothetical protein
LALACDQRAQAVFAPGDLCGHVHPVECSLRIAALGQRQQLHFLAQLRLDLVGVRPRQGLVLAGVGLDLGAVQRDGPKLEQLHLARQHQHLHEQRLDP